MAKVSLVKGTQNYTVQVFLQDSSSTTGAGLAGLAHNTANLVAYYSRPGAAPAAITLATQTVTGAFSSGGFVAVDGTNMPGLYRFDVPNAAIASGVLSVVIMFKGATNLVPTPLEIELTAVNNQDAVRGGMTALPNANAAAAGGLLTFGTGSGQINPPILATLEDLLEADRVVDTAVTPWALVLIKRGSGALGAPGAVELVRQKLYDVNGGAITNANTILGRSIT